MFSGDIISLSNPNFSLKKTFILLNANINVLISAFASNEANKHVASLWYINMEKKNPVIDHQLISYHLINNEGKKLLTKC